MGVAAGEQRRMALCRDETLTSRNIFHLLDISAISMPISKGRGEVDVREG